MGIFGTIFKTVVDVALLPVAVVSDVIEISVGEDPKSTANQLENIKEDLDELTD